MSNMKTRWKIILGVLIGAAVIGTILFQNTRPLEADLLQVQPSNIAKTFVEDGAVVSKIERPIYPAYGGKIAQLPVAEGDTTDKGGVLAVLESKELMYQIKQLQGQLVSLEGEQKQSSQEPYEAQIRSQQLAVEQASNGLKTAENNFGRVEELFEAGITTKSEYEEAQDAVERARINLKQQKEALDLLYESHSPSGGTKQFYAGRREALQAQIDLLKYQLANYKIASPVDGVVSDLTVKEGMTVSPNMPIMTIFQRDAYQVEVYVLTEDLVNVKKGEKVQLVQDKQGGNVPFEGIVSRIAPSAVEKMSPLGLNERRVKVTLEPNIPANMHLRPGYTLEVIFTVGKQQNKLVVPKTALFPYEKGEALWIVRQGEAAVQPVEKGFENDIEVVISKGLKSGDLVILNPQLEGLQEGQKVVGKGKE